MLRQQGWVRATGHCTRWWCSSMRMVSTGGASSSGAQHCEDAALHTSLLHRVREALGIQKDLEWKQVRTKQLRAIPEGKELLKAYGGSIHAALLQLQPGFNLPRPMVDRRVPAAHWEEKFHRAEFLTAVGAVRDLKEPRDWLLYGRAAIVQYGGSYLLSELGLRVLVQELYPTVDLDTVERSLQVSKPPGYWGVRANRRAFYEKVEKALNISVPEDWKRVKASDVLGLGGRGILGHFGNSMAKMLEEHLGEEAPVIARGRVPKGYWALKANREDMIKKIETSLGIVSMEDWSKVTVADVERSHPGASGLLNFYGGSILAMVQDMEGEDVAPFLCRPTTAKEVWRKEESVRAFLEEAKERLHIKSSEDWSRVSLEQIRQLPGGVSFAKQWSLADALRQAFPAEQWDHVGSLGSEGRLKASQRHLRVSLENILL